MRAGVRMSFAGSRRTHRALESGVHLLHDVQPEGARPLHAALLQEQDQPAHGRGEHGPALTNG